MYFIVFSSAFHAHIMRHDKHSKAYKDLCIYSILYYSFKFDLVSVKGWTKNGAVRKRLAIIFQRNLVSYVIKVDILSLGTLCLYLPDTHCHSLGSCWSQ